MPFESLLKGFASKKPNHQIRHYLMVGQAYASIVSKSTYYNPNQLGKTLKKFLSDKTR